MKYNIRHDLSILGSAEYPTGIQSLVVPTGVQSALVVVDDDYSGLKVYLGCANSPSEDEIYQKVAGLGDELRFEFIERLYLELKKGKEKENETI